MIPKTLPAFSVLAELGKNYRYVSGRSAYFCLRTRTPSAARGQAVRRATSAKCGVLLHKSVCRVKSIRVFWDNVLKVSKVLKVVKVFNVDNVFFPKIADACNRRYRRLRGVRSPRLVKALFYYTSSSGFSGMGLGLLFRAGISCARAP